MLKKIKTYFGFDRELAIDVTYLKDFEFTDHIDEKIEYLKSLDVEETDRKDSIEAKTAQLIGQTGIIFSILSLFISIYFSKVKTWPVVFQVMLVTLFIVSLLFYLMTIFKAIRYLDIKRYIYGQRDVNTVKRKFENGNAFKVIEVKDLIYSIERNIQVTNLKCDNLIFAYRFFRIGTATVGTLAILLLVTAYFPGKTEINSIKITEPIKIQGLDTSKIIKGKPDAALNTLLKKDTAK